MIGYAAFDLDATMPLLDFNMNVGMTSIKLSKNNFK
jgi:hypothetical protein